MTWESFIESPTLHFVQKELLKQQTCSLFVKERCRAWQQEQNVTVHTQEKWKFTGHTMQIVTNCVFTSMQLKWRKAKQRLCSHRREAVLGEGSWTYKQVLAYFLSYFKTIIKIADFGWIFHAVRGSWELRPSGSSSAFLPLKREVVVCSGRKQRYGVMSVLAESRGPRHAHLLVNISCPTPIRAAEDFNVCLHICSPLLYPGYSNNDLLFKHNRNIQRLHIGQLYKLFPFLLVNATSLEHSWKTTKHVTNLNDTQRSIDLNRFLAF